MAMVMAAEQSGPPRCANCGVGIPWRPTLHRDKTYCCGGCAQGGPCYCSYDWSLHDWQPRLRTQRHRDREGVYPESGR
jgi:hypothetical protein